MLHRTCILPVISCCITLTGITAWSGEFSHTERTSPATPTEHAYLTNYNGNNITVGKQITCKHCNISNIASRNRANLYNSKIDYMQSLEAKLRNASVGYIYLIQTLHDAHDHPFESRDSAIDEIYVNNFYKNNVYLNHFNPTQSSKVHFAYTGGIVYTDKSDLIQVINGTKQITPAMYYTSEQNFQTNHSSSQTQTRSESAQRNSSAQTSDYSWKEIACCPCACCLVTGCVGCCMCTTCAGWACDPLCLCGVPQSCLKFWEGFFDGLGVTEGFERGLNGE